MDTYESCSYSSDLVTYLIGEGSESEITFMSKHLLSCSICFKEMQNLMEVWNYLPYHIEEEEVPADLKQEVMDHIFEFKNPPPTERIWNFIKLLTSFQISLYGWVAVTVILVIGGLIWNNVSLRGELSEAVHQTHLPSEIIQIFTLKTANPLKDSAYGNAWLYKQGDQKKLVVQISGLPITKGTEVYQGWMIYEGNRKSAGVFYVDQQGNGFLTHVLGERDIEIEAIGISLEPDPNGTQPRGKKVLGT